MRISYDVFMIEMVCTLVSVIENTYLEVAAPLFTPNAYRWRGEGHDRRPINGRVIADTKTTHVPSRVQGNEFTSRRTILPHTVRLVGLPYPSG